MLEFFVSEIKGIEFTFIEKKDMNLLKAEDSFSAKCFHIAN